MKKVQSQFGAGALQQKILVGEFSLLADADSNVGGCNTGPSPHEYLAVALASCSSMTLKMYAQRKAWKLLDAIVTVDISREDEVELFSVDILLSGELDIEQRARLLEIANKCPVHKALSGKIQIKTQLIN
jgi:putative redox protein